MSVPVAETEWTLLAYSWCAPTMSLLHQLAESLFCGGLTPATDPGSGRTPHIIDSFSSGTHVRSAKTTITAFCETAGMCDDDSAQTTAYDEAYAQDAADAKAAQDKAFAEGGGNPNVDTAGGATVGGILNAATPKL